MLMPLIVKKSVSSDVNPYSFIDRCLQYIGTIYQIHCIMHQEMVVVIYRYTVWWRLTLFSVT